MARGSGFTRRMSCNRFGLPTGARATAIQAFGGAGFTQEYDVQLYYKRLLSTQMTLGCSQTWLEELATLVIDNEAPPIVPEH